MNILWNRSCSAQQGYDLEMRLFQGFEPKTSEFRVNHVKPIFD